MESLKTTVRFTRDRLASSCGARSREECSCSQRSTSGVGCTALVLFTPTCSESIPKEKSVMGGRG